MQEKDSSNVLCVSCLCIGRTLNKLSESLFKFYMDALYEIPLSNMARIEPAVCWECEAILKKCLSFREQVKDSYRILQTYTVENLHECLLSEVSRPPRLKLHTNDHVDILPYKEVKIEYDRDFNKNNTNCNSSDSDDLNTDEIQTALCDLKNEYNSIEIEEKDCLSLKQCTEIKNELDDDDVTKYERNDIGINEVIVKGKAKKNKMNRIRIKEEKRRKIKNNTKDGKIKQIQLSYEEMMKERLGLAQRETFVNSPHKCESCILSFTTALAYTTHMSSKHSDDLVTNYQCPICKTVMSTVEAFTAHYKRHTRRYECTVCQKRGVDVKTLQRHYETTHGRCLKEYRGGLRGKLSKLEKHSLDTETQKKRVQCSECEKTFSHRAGLMNHRISVHEAQNEFPCKLCKKVFRWKTSLKRHLEKHASNTQTPEAFCSTCGIGFGSVASLQRHLRNSLKHVTPDQLKYICDHCKRRFADKTKLRDHIEDKHLNRTYQCYICDKPSKNRVGLEQHIRNVHKGRPNNKMCHHCGKGFPTKVQLESHIRTHTGERPFICEYCPTTFSQQSNLYKHHRQVHQSIRMKKKKLPTLKKNVGSVETNSEDPSLPLAVIQYMALPDSMFAV